VNRGAVAEISLKAIASNLQIIKKLVKRRPVIAVVKADAYGHGAVEVSKRLLQHGVSSLAVAFTSEAIELREAGIKAPILVLFDQGDVEQFFDFRLVPVVYSLKTASLLSRVAKKRGSVLGIHVKVDTGMGRMGLRGKNVINDLIKISKMDGLELAGLMSHFSEADLLDRSYAAIQLKRFMAIRDEISKVLKRKIFSHIANSAAVLSFRDGYLDAVRPGLMLYGYTPFSQDTSNIPFLKSLLKRGYALTPTMRVATRILCVRTMPSGSPISYGRTFITKRKSRIGVIPIGYADGYSRSFSNNAKVLVRGRRVPVVGRVCMDLTMVDLTDVKEARENNEVVIMGNQGKESITAYELASRINTIPYEILTSLGIKSRKIYTV
jgi:alanine racemase